MKDKVLFAISGSLAGAVNGLLGAGGGMILVPMLIRVCKLEPRKALPCSIAAILPMSAVSAFRYVKNTGINILSLWPYLLGGLAGGILAGLLFPKVNVVWLRRTLGIFILYAGVRMLIGV